jgi:two-component system C4-dicarboxylate transport sensor histidine kinase DctB
LFISSLGFAATGFLYPALVSESIEFGDIAGPFIDLLVIAFVARFSSCTLRKVQDRSEEHIAVLQKTHTEKMVQIYQLSELGKLSAGLIHDLVNPLTVASLNLVQAASDIHSKSLEHIEVCVGHALLATRRMEGYVCTARKQLQHQCNMGNFSLVEEMQQVKQMMEYKANLLAVVVRMQCLNDVMVYGSNVRFSQVMANVVANAIDAYENCECACQNKIVDIRLKNGENGDAIISVQDFGAGIKTEYVSSIFDPFFTTKSNGKGMGIGLCIAKQIIEKDFHGTLSIQSVCGRGTICTIILPKNNEHTCKKV